jgi:hypothetical protein
VTTIDLIIGELLYSGSSDLSERKSMTWEPRITRQNVQKNGDFQKYVPASQSENKQKAKKDVTLERPSKSHCMSYRFDINTIAPEHDGAQNMKSDYLANKSLAKAQLTKSLIRDCQIELYELDYISILTTLVHCK